MTKLTLNSKPIPKIQDLVKDPELAFKNNELKILLNQPPPAAWIQKNKYANNSEYLSIDKVEYLLDALFQSWKVEVLEAKPVFNSISVTVRLHYIDPINGTWQFHDGVGAKELQTKAESGNLKPDFSNINKGAVEMALPIAKTSAIKDAADHLGKLFGRDLNRKYALEYTIKYNNPETIEAKNQSQEKSNLIDFINRQTSISGLNEVVAELHLHGDTEYLIALWEAKQTEINNG